MSGSLNRLDSSKPGKYQLNSSSYFELILMLLLLLILIDLPIFFSWMKKYIAFWREPPIGFFFIDTTHMSLLGYMTNLQSMCDRLGLVDHQKILISVNEVLKFFGYIFCSRASERYCHMAAFYHLLFIVFPPTFTVIAMWNTMDMDVRLLKVRWSIIGRCFFQSPMN